MTQLWQTYCILPRSSNTAHKICVAELLSQLHTTRRSETINLSHLRVVAPAQPSYKGECKAEMLGLADSCVVHMQLVDP